MVHSLQHGGGDLCPFWPNVLVLQEILCTWYQVTSSAKFKPLDMNVSYSHLSRFTFTGPGL
jgi:hypothetical protein